MSQTSNVSYRWFLSLVATSLLVPHAASAQMLMGSPPPADGSTVPFSLNPPVVPGAEAPMPPEAPEAPAVAEPAAEAAPKDWTEMNKAELEAEKTRLEGELARSDSQYTPVEKKKMRNLLKRIETELSRKALEPGVMTTGGASGKEGAPVKGEAEGKEDADDKASAYGSYSSKNKAAKPEKERELNASEKMREKIRSRRFGTPKNAFPLTDAEKNNQIQ